MMKIDTNNYEAYALDYLEGTLPPGQEQAFQSFLEGHPEIKAEIESLENVQLQPEPALVFPEKEKLYRKKRRIIPIAWSLNGWGIGLAAAISCAALAYTWMYNPDQTPGNELAEDIPVNYESVHSENTETLAQLSTETTQTENTLEANTTENPIKTNGTNETSGNTGVSQNSIAQNNGQNAATNPVRAVETIDGKELRMEDETDMEDIQLALSKVTEGFDLAEAARQHEAMIGNRVKEIEPTSVQAIDLDTGQPDIATVDIQEIEVKKGKKGLNLPFFENVKIKAHLNTFPVSFGKTDKEKVKEALLPSIFASAD